jgi:hypothetical protein
MKFQGVGIGLLTLIQLFVNNFIVSVEVFGDMLDLSVQGGSDISSQVIDVEFHILSVILTQGFELVLYIFVNSQKRGYLVGVDVNQIFILEIFQKDLSPIRSVLGKAI